MRGASPPLNAQPVTRLPQSPVPVLALLAVTALCAGSTWVSLALTRLDGGVATLWIANGLLTGVLLLRPRERWFWWFLGAGFGQLGVRLTFPDAFATSLVLTGINLAEAWLVAHWIRRGTRSLREFDSLAVVARTAFGASIVACALSAYAAVLVTQFMVTHVTTAPLVTWFTWFSAHLLGMVVVATLTACTFQPHVRLLGRAGKRLDYFACIALLLGTCALIVSQGRFPLLFLAYLPLLLLTFRHGVAGMVVGVLVLAMATGLALAASLGPFALVPGESPLERMLLWQLFIASACLLVYPTAVSMAERRRLHLRVRASEARYRMLADHSQDLIVRVRRDGTWTYVSPAAHTLLGYDAAELEGSAPTLLHRDDRAAVGAMFERLFAGGGREILRFRLRHRDGHDRWFEAAASAAEGPDGRELVFSAREISKRVAAEQDRAATQAQLEAITDNLPAMVARLDREGRYVYANARSQALVPDVDLIGKSLRELRGEQHYAELAPHVDAVLAGQPQGFDTYVIVRGQAVELHAQFVPDRAADGSVQGFYSVSFDITAAKNAERELERLAREDKLTGLANRHEFDERVTDAVLHAARNGTALALLSLDLDRFKQINDSHGHAVGDAVLQEFALRLRGAVYDVDLVARLGGDEFVVLVDYTPRRDVVEAMATRIVAMMRPPMRVGGLVVQAATSIGVGLHQPVQSAERLLALADEALYEAKARGRNTWAFRAG
jgi:diguanylate cyclase (GGDEF)-like protein/PAS domain S-box-containing protein